MSDSRAAREQELLAGLFDRFLDAVLEGAEPNLEPLIAEHPELEDEIQQTWRLARETAGRTPQSRPEIEGYRLLYELGRGGMGVVYLAEHESLGRQVALKILPQAASLSSSARRRFLSEARALARLDSDHVVRIYNIIERDDLLAYGMEWVDGTSFRDLLSRLGDEGHSATLTDLRKLLGAEPGVLGERSLLLYYVRIGVSMARALQAVHEAGLVHRDVKPSNILIRRDGTALLADFGLVRGADASASVTGGFVGTLRYASPEQLREDRDQIDARTDVYALGVALWEAVAGRAPFDGNSSAALLKRIESGDVPRLRRIAPHVPRDLETVLTKAMEANPAARYTTAEEFGADLDRILRLQPVSARPVGSLRRLGRWARRHRRIIAAAGLGVAFGMATLVPGIVDARSQVERSALIVRHVEDARSRLLSPVARWRAWRRSVQGSVLEAIRLQASDLDFEAALAEYDAALALDPEDRSLRIERVVVAAAMVSEDRVSGAVDASELDMDVLPPLTRRVAEGLISTSLRPEFELEEVRAAAVDDRMALGLLAFLIGDANLCEVAWQDLDQRDSAGPLISAALGLLYRVDGRPSLAYPRLARAAAALPGVPFLRVELAAAALELGDRQVAEQRLDQLEADGVELSAADRQFVIQLRAGLALQDDDFATARALLEPLAENPRNLISGVGAQLAEIDRREGQLGAAESRLAKLVELTPLAARYRLALARVAIERGRLGTYMQQVTWVLNQDFGQGRSVGTVCDMLGILRMGGLRGLYDEGVTATGIRLPQDGDDVWPRDSVLGNPLEDREVVETLARRVATYQSMSDEFWLPSWVGSESNAFGLLSDAVRLMVNVPELLRCEQVPCCLVARGASVGLQAYWSEFMTGLAPALLGIEDPSGVESHLLYRFVGDRPGDQIAALAVVDDMDRDGVDEIFIGVRMDQEVRAGSVRLLSGLDGRTMWVLNEDRPAARFGVAVAALGDLDGDGLPEVAAGAPSASAGYRQSGALQINSGRTRRELRRLWGPREMGLFGWVIKNAGDIDGDGVADILVGAPGFTTSVGHVSLFSGHSGELIWEIAGKPTARFGSEIEVLEDVDGDGAPDLAVGSMFDNYAQGLVTVHSGRTGALIRELHGRDSGRLFGLRICAGDIDGDGRQELAISSPLDMSDDGRAGRVYLFSTRSWERMAEIVGEDGDNTFFGSLAFGNFDGDDCDDLAVGSPEAIDNGAASGRVTIYAGSGIGTDGPLTVLRRYRGKGPGDEFGYQLATFQDLDGDGLDELLVSAPGAAQAAGEVLLLTSGTLR